MYRGIKALPNGTTLWIDDTGERRSRRYFSVASELAKASDTPLNLTKDQIDEQLREALLETVWHHLVADVPVGMFLSAGVDSGTLTGLAKEASTADLRTVTLGFKEFQDTAHDEVPLAEIVAKQYNTDHHTAWITRTDFQSRREAILCAMDQPSIDGVNVYFVSEAAANAGLKVAFSGLGGDELFGGYASFQQIPRLVGAISSIHATPLVARGFRYISASILSRFTSPKYAGLLEYGGTYAGAYLLRRGMFMPWELPTQLDPDIVKKGWEELKVLSHLEATTDPIKSPRLKVTALETNWYMRNQLLRDADWASMAHSLEIRVPFADIELYRVVASLVGTKSPPGKCDMARTPRTPLPNDIVERRKTGFSVPIRDWIMDSSEMASAERGIRGWAKVVLAHTMDTGKL
jgi:asparagine synthase (glutamine-hydrolysing)